MGAWRRELGAMDWAPAEGRDGAPSRGRSGRRLPEGNPAGAGAGELMGTAGESVLVEEAERKRVR